MATPALCAPKLMIHQTQKLVLIKLLYLVNASLETVAGDLSSLGPVDQGLADLAHLEH